MCICRSFFTYNNNHNNDNAFYDIVFFNIISISEAERKKELPSFSLSFFLFIVIAYKLFHSFVYTVESNIKLKILYCLIHFNSDSVSNTRKD